MRVRATCFEILAACLIAATLHADPRVTWLSEHAVSVRSIDPADADFRDLEPLRATLANVRVVMLGEQSHGDGATFLAKTRLIRFLHEQMGFDVLAFESGLYDCAKAWDLLREGKEDAISRGVFRIWSDSREVQPLIAYLNARAKSSRPLELAGVDCQLTGSASTDFLPGDLQAFATGDEWSRVAPVLRKLSDGTWEQENAVMPPAEEQAEFARILERWRSAIAARDKTPATQPWSGAFWRQFLASLRVTAEQTWRSDMTNPAGSPAVFAMRDRQMGENLVWLANERYPNRKIIVWAATFHNARRIDTIRLDDPKLKGLYAVNVPMGEVARRALGTRLYSLAFTAYEGEAASMFAKSAKPLPKASPDSLEDLFHRAGLANGFVDFRTAPRWLKRPLTARLLGHVEMRADWTRVVDGVLFLPRMERSHRR
jgi:erythromycin esterase